MKIIGLNKRFNDNLLFDNFSCEIADSKINYLLGASGSGKTTLLRIISGLDRDFLGSIEPTQNKISYVFQEPRLLPSLSALENVKIVRENSEKLSIELLSLLELKDALNKKPDELSGGMKMRVNLARALNYDADLYLMDEPFSALDEETKDRILPKVFEILKDKTIVIVSHNIEEANKYAENIINISSPLTN